MPLENSLILRTKLYPPPITPDLVPRSHLIDRLERNWQRPITLISAPAGFGKSMLASLWLHARDRPSGWVSLDERDNELLVFTAYLLAAIKMAFPNLSLQSEALLETANPLPAHMLARSFLNDLDQIETPFVLVLDDLHAIHDRAIFDFLTGLLEHPPRAMHLVLISRKDPPLPIASLRAYKRINEIRLRDLRFDWSETAKLLKQMLQREIDEDLAKKWTLQTEGWATGIHLIALSLNNRYETTNTTASIENQSYYLQEYLLVEVLADISPDRRTWLLKTALLDRFCAPLCEAVCQEEGEGLTGQTFMSWLWRSNLFLISLDDQGEWFRFHHLFQSHLRNLVQKELNEKALAKHHLRASQWLAADGWFEEAIRHALLAEETETVATIFLQARHQLMNRDYWLNLEHLLTLLPATIVTSNPALLLTKAFIAAARSNTEEFTRSSEQAKQFMVDLPPDSSIELKGEFAVMHCITAFASGPADVLIDQGNIAIELLPKEEHYLRGIAVGALMLGYQMSGNSEQCIRVLEDMLSNRDWPSKTHARILLYAGYIRFIDADLVRAKRYVRESLQLSKNQSLGDAVKSAQYILGKIHYLQNDLPAAEAYLLALLENPAISPPTYLAHAACILGRIYTLQNKQEEASRILNLASALFEDLANWPLLEIIRAFQVELALSQGNINQAKYLSAGVNFNARSPLWFYYLPQLTPAKLLYAQGTSAHLEKALSNLEQLGKQFSAWNRKTVTIDVLALQALVYEAQENLQQGEEKLQMALDLAEPGGFIRNFLDLGQPMFSLLSRLQEQGNTGMGPYISQILSAFSLKETDATAPDQPIQLTKRETQILSLLATDLSPEEMAIEMTISPATVRTHIRNLYAKLEVNRRFEAVYKAKELSLI